ncbi:MAG: AAA family ATPase, partial [Aeromicrobium sp.]
MSGQRSTGTATVLFTDLVGSTDLRSRLGEEAADQVRRRHDEVVTAAIEGQSGHVVKSLGDGLMAVFESSADAVAAAIDAQQRVTALGSELPEPIEIRAGASVGDVSIEDGDYFGTAVNEAARLCGVAQGGQILVADLVRALARGRGGFNFEPVGSLELKGLPDPVATCSVSWEALSLARAVDQVPFPPALAPATNGPYIGRPDLQTTLCDLWDQARAGGARTALMVGEPGIGKTRTAYEIAKQAHAHGAVVLFGRCDDGLMAPYQPFVEALDWQTRHAPELPLGRLAGELRRLVPDLEERRSDLPAPVTSDPRTEEHRLFEAVASWLIETATESGLVLVLDDVHWATKPTLLMMIHAIRQAADADGARLLLIATYRDTDVDRTHPLSALLGDLQRIDGVHRIPVAPLDVDEVIDLVEQAAGHELDEVTRGVATLTHAETEGNPFFVGEVLRHLIESGGVRFIEGRWVVPHPDQIVVPEGVRDVVGQRLSLLSETANEVLRAASVIGREFDLDLAGDLVGIEESALLDALDEATRARLVEEIAADRYRFAHALVRTSLYDELSASRRRRIHRRVTEFHAKKTHPDLAALAHHAVEAGPQGGDLSDAIGYVLAAADQARATRALGEAKSLYGKALELLDEDEALPLDPRRLGARCGIGEIMRDQGDSSFREALLAVSDHAVEAGNDALIIRAALANTRGFTSIVGDVDDERIAHLEEALRRVPDSAKSELARLEAQLAAELIFEPDRVADRLALVGSALARADELDDDLTIAQVLWMTRVPDVVPERWTTGIDLDRRAIEAADRCGDPNLRVLARIGLGWTLLAIGDLAAAQDNAEEFLAIAVNEAGPVAVWYARAAVAQFPMYFGDIAESVARNEAALELGMEVGAPDAPQWWGALDGVIRWCRDASFSDHELSAAMADQFPRAPIWRCTQAMSLALADRFDEAREVIRTHELDRIYQYPKDYLWHCTGNIMSLTARRLADVGLAKQLLAHYEPFADDVIHFVIAVYGPVRQITSRARAVLGDLDGSISDATIMLDWGIAQSMLVPSVIYRIELAELL